MLIFNQQQSQHLTNGRAAFNHAQRQLHGNAAGLPADFWKQIDTGIGLVQRDILAVFNDLAASVSRPFPIGIPVSEFIVASDSGQLTISMDGISDGPVDTTEYAHFSSAVPIFASPFRYGWRAVEGASTKGLSLDVAPRDGSLRTVAEGLEDMALNGSAKIVVNGEQLYGLRNHPKRTTSSMGSLTGGNLNGATGPEWVAEITALIESLHAKNFYAPITIYLNYSDWFYASNTDYSTQYPNKTILQRVQEIAGIAGIVPASKVPADEILGVVKRTDVIQILNAMPTAVLPKFRANAHDDYQFVAGAAAGIQIRHDFNDQCGVAHRS